MPSPVVLLAVAFQTATQAPGLPPGPPTRDGDPPPPPMARALRVPAPPVIDGRDTDDIWRLTPPITQFRQWNPTEDGEPRFPTEARIAYDDRHIYVFVRAFDPQPDSIVRLLARRDSWTPADRIGVVLDSYHDRRSGYEFWVNAAGVKVDAAITNDGDEDDAWDAVWDGEVLVDSLGWTAEFRIPLSQLRYAPAASNTFGIMVMRDIQRYTVRESWPVLRRSRSGWPSQFGELQGLDGLGTPRRLEVTPYAVTKNVRVSENGGTAREQQITGGADVKYGLTSNLTVDATVNPDFGQVEADPGVLNLSAFETFFQERRPFFVEGMGTFRFRVNCSNVNCGSEGLFYSRRIGRAPQLGGRYGDASSATASTILGAAKLTGRLASGLTVGLLDAVTLRETGTRDSTGAFRTTEPATNYLTLRLQQDLRRSESGVGLMLTAVNREMDRWTEPLLRSTAYAAAMDVRHRFPGRRYQLWGRFAVSRVAGSEEAILATQTSPVHFYQRPDAGLTVDPTRTTLWGDMQEVGFAKVGGRLTRFETAFLRRSAGFEVNDLGFMRRADQQAWTNWFGLQLNRPTKWYRQANWNFNWWQYWTTAGGMPTEAAFNTNLHAQLNNRWWIHAGGTLGQIGRTLCDFCTRGGPAARQDPYLAPWAGVSGDDRHRIVPELWVNYTRGDVGHSEFMNVNPAVTFRVSPQVNTSIGVSLTRNTNDVQFYGNLTDSVGTTHYTFARLPQKEAALQLRMDYTVTRTLSLQVYAQPFVSKGTFRNVRELTSPRADAYADRYQPYGDTAVTSNPGGFNFGQFRSNVVLRWEYRPGSTLFVVWTQGRDDFANREGTLPLNRDMRDLFRLAPNNTLLVKASYWLSW